MQSDNRITAFGTVGMYAFQAEIVNLMPVIQAFLASQQSPAACRENRTAQCASDLKKENTYKLRI
jgi:hypothetical protein